jgi:hypothetical protein
MKATRLTCFGPALLVILILLIGCNLPAIQTPVADAAHAETEEQPAERTTTNDPPNTSQSSQTSTPPPTSTHRPTAARTATPTPTVTPSPSATRKPSATRDPNATIGPTRTPQPTTPATLVPGAQQPYTSVVSNVGSQLNAVYALGQQLGNYSGAFSKIGDCEAAFPTFLQGFDAGSYDLGSYQYLSGVLSYFAGSYGRVGQAADGGMSSTALLLPIWANPAYCQSEETPLACEYRIQKPSIALIMVRTSDAKALASGQYHSELTQIVQYTLSQGIIPVLSTVPYWGPNNPDTTVINDTIRRVAAENNIPIWDFWITSEQLPNRGVTQDYHIADPAYTRSTYFDSDSLQMAVTRRNLEALEVLHMILTQVIQ